MFLNQILVSHDSQNPFLIWKKKYEKEYGRNIVLIEQELAILIFSFKKKF